MSRAGARHVVAWYASSAACAVAAIMAAPPPAIAQDSAWEPQTEVGTGVVINDNALLGRRGQFVGERSTDYANVLRWRHESGYRLAPSTRLVGIGEATLLALRSQEELRSADFLVDVSLEQGIGDTARLIPELAGVYHPEASRDWGFWLVRPGLRAELPPLAGVLTDLRYEFSLQEFFGDAPRRTFGNLDNRGHRGEVRLRYWLGSDWRLALTYRIDVFTFSSNLLWSDPPLVAFVGLPEGTERQDFTNVVQPEVSYLAGGSLVLTLGYRFEDNRSNSPAFRYRAHRTMAVGYWEVTDRHIAFTEVRYGIYDFYSFQFDSRYRNTRSDLRLDVAANYRFVVNDSFYLQARYGLLLNDSNDSINFNPGTSLSFSTFSQNRFELLGMVTF